MQKMCIIGISAIITLHLILQVRAQIPMPCASNYTSSGGSYCCPEAKVNGRSIGACGSEDGRGECIAVSDLCNVGYDSSSEQAPDCMQLYDKRLNWPVQFFTHVCRCNDNFGDYDCGSCTFGYTSVESRCNQKISEPRRSITSLSDEEWKAYLDLLNKSKHEISTRYLVLNGTEEEYTTISVYDLFVWVHHYVAKNHIENYLKNYTGCDYGHHSTGFLSWHRIYLLWFERELQILSGNESFRFSYWNWTNFEGESDWRGLLFNDNRLGGYNSDGNVTGPYFNAENWDTICIRKLNVVCDPKESTGGLVRCPVGDRCTSSYNGWPTRADIDAALATGSFSDPDVFNKYSENSFANYVEGYVPTEDCSESTLCAEDSESGVSFDVKLHTTVHVILGIGSLSDVATSPPYFFGAMADRGASPIDPVFINHHTMLDYIFEEWLQSQNNPTYQGPTNSLFPGHSAEDCIVPFIPVYTQSTVFRTADHFGYYYARSEPDNTGTGPGSGSTPDTGSGSSSSLEPFSFMTIIALLSVMINKFLQ